MPIEWFVTTLIEQPCSDDSNTQERHHKNTTTKTPPQKHHHTNTTTQTPPRKHHHTNTTTQTPPHKHHHKNTTTQTPPQKHHHKNAKTPPQKHSSTTPYYKVLLQYYKVHFQYYSVITKYYASTTKYYSNRLFLSNRASLSLCPWPVAVRNYIRHCGPGPQRHRSLTVKQVNDQILPDDLSNPPKVSLCRSLAFRRV